MKKYKDTDYCEHCDKDTLQEIWDAEHERDLSSDSKKCLECGWEWRGYTDKWEAPIMDIEDTINIADLESIKIPLIRPNFTNDLNNESV